MTLAAALERPPFEAKAIVRDPVHAAREISANQLAPLVHKIDQDGFYPKDVMKALGKADVFSTHLTGAQDGSADLTTSIKAMSVVGEHCLSTSFCVWCQDALGWYIATSPNKAVRETLLKAVASGAQLGGTGLSNPMKAFFGIEKLRLKAKRTEGGYVVKGRLPWVSNLGPNHYFGAIFEMEDNPKHRVMAAVSCKGPGIEIGQYDHFIALEGTGTESVKFAQAFISDDMVIADPIDSYIPKIRSGFILLQSGMAFGLIRNCIDLMKQMQSSHGHVNKYLDKQPEDFEDMLRRLEDEVFDLART
ncbi:MAG: acyl-CoA/acyl-ACP dehydrogenase, partial [Beijerinckiaceae bacterium]|nr:acyl-CoA/acyl-ACP dehydrogenase [Beijerinckiaceae bacterium]